MFAVYVEPGIIIAFPPIQEALLTQLINFKDMFVRFDI
jgi:hypothetical protein